MREFWIEMSVPSPTPTDTVIERDHAGKCVEMDGEYKKVRKRFHVEYDYEVFERWKTDKIDLIEEHLHRHEKKTNINTDRIMWNRLEF